MVLLSTRSGIHTCTFYFSSFFFSFFLFLHYIKISSTASSIKMICSTASSIKIICSTASSIKICATASSMQHAIVTGAMHVEVLSAGF